MELSRPNKTMTSLQIAELTGKTHSDLLKSIREQELAWVKIGQGKFSLGSYIDKNNQARPMYELNRSECLYIATKFNDEARAKLIIRWEELENAQPKVPASTLDILEMTIKNLREQNLQLDEVKSDLKSLKTTVAEIKVFNAPIEHFSIMGYCRNVKKQIGIAEAKVFGTKARALCNQLGYVIGKIPDPRFGTVNTYPLDVLREVISN